jgi:Leucine-rich repeat (LRR) protein
VRDAAIVEQLAGGRPIVELTHARQRTSGEVGVLRRDGAVTVICAHRANLERLPDSIGELAALERLDVGDNRLSELPALPVSLRELYVYDNQLVRLPALPALQVLDANRNRLAEVAAIRDVGFVYLAGNRLAAAPATSGVRYLNVGDNPLGDLAAPGAAPDAAIEELRAEHAELVSLAIDGLTGLRELSLRNNRLAALPASIGSLPWLRTLDLRGNQLDELPDTLRGLPLTKLDLRWNPLRARPRWLDELARRGCLVYV